MKKRKPIKRIELEKGENSKVKENQRPSCFNTKRNYCRRDLCGEWYDKCQPLKK